MEMIPVSFAEAPASLGGLMLPSGVDLVSTRSSFYSSIKRMKSLPPLKIPKSVSKDNAWYQMYERLSRGDFFVDLDNRKIDGKHTKVLVSFDAETKNECFAVVFVEHGNKIALNVIVANYVSSSSVFKKMYAALSSSERQRLLLRILHHYVRSSGFRLSWSDLQLFRRISRSILRRRESDMHGLEAIDIGMSLADIGMNHGADHRFILCAFRDVCEALHVLRRHTDAALVYEEAAEDYCQFEFHETIAAKLDLFAFAGDEWANAEIFDRAEEAYIKAFNISSRNNVDLSHERVQQIIPALFLLYSEWTKRKEMERQAFAEITAVKCILATLVAMAGFRLQQKYITLIKPEMIQDKLKEGKQALLALDGARKSSTPQGFRDAILSCALNPKKSHSRGKGVVENTNTKESRPKTTSMAKETGAEFVKCSNPACGAIEGGETGVELMQCLCRGANYCDRRCQKAHWQEHKCTCTYYLERKGSKK